MRQQTLFIYFLTIFLLIASLNSYAKSPAKIQQSQLPIPYRSATELTKMIRDGKISSLELLNIYLNRIEHYNDTVNAVVATDVESARKRAKAADEALKRGEIWGRLHGLPMTVKDVFEVVGMPATSGDPAFKDYVPKRNAIAVQRLIDAGAIVFGKTNTPYHAEDVQSYNEIYGTTRNPWDLTRTSGGSSGGSSAALAAGFTPLELGSDIGGSVRIPSHFAGVFGHKPTFGIVPRFGHLPPMPPGIPPQFMPSIPLFVVGPLARNTDDLELVLEIISGVEKSPDSKRSQKLLPTRHKRFSEYRVAVWITDPSSYGEVDSEVSTVLNKAVTKLRTAGLKVDINTRPEMSLVEIVQVWNDVYMSMRARMLPLPKAVAEQQKKLFDTMREFFEKYDVLLTPITPTVATPHDHEGSLLTRTIIINGNERPALNTIYWNMLAVPADLPSTAVPIGLSKKGLPVGIQVVGGKYEDRTTLAFARELSKLTGRFRIPPGYDK